MPGGRPTKLDPKISKSIIEALKAGNYIDTACRIVQIEKKTFYNWMNRGRQGEAPFAEFLHGCEKAIADSEQSMLAEIRAAGKRNWQAIAWIMERRFRQRWSKPSENGSPNSTNPPPPMVTVKEDQPKSS